ncbi:MAG: SHOCT domain-containing protein [Marinisporobacter sp.]|jgi:putative membrane protein|nr:SHOCT domain-containing protein [Marinisporobacter sp.]
MCGFGFGYTGWWGWMFLRTGLGIAVTIGLVIWITKLIKNTIQDRRNGIQFLDERFARGELSEEEYIQKKKVLSDK